AQLNNIGSEIKKVNEKVYAAQDGCGQLVMDIQEKDKNRSQINKTEHENEERA
ncbi:hypothetical protein Tco_0544605, partial [Tanacetum coccineum]